MRYKSVAITFFPIRKKSWKEDIFKTVQVQVLRIFSENSLLRIEMIQ